MLKSKSYRAAFAVGAVLLAGGALASVVADVAVHPSRHVVPPVAAKVAPPIPDEPRRIVQKITTFKPGDPASEARHFDFEDYSFKSLDAAVLRLFPPGTKLSYVDKVLQQQGGAKKSEIIANEFVHYDYHFHFGRFDCVRTVFVNFDNKTQRVISVQGDGRCR